MRFVRVLAAVLLLIIGIPVLLAGGTLWQLTRHADPGGAFGARFEPLHTSGHAVVVTDLDALLHAEAPFARAGEARLRLDARTPDGPAFIGLAPTEEVRSWLDRVPHAAVRRVALSRGPLPVLLEPAGPATPAGSATAPAGSPAATPTAAPSAGAAGPPAAVPPLGRSFWVRDAIGSLEWTPQELTGRQLSLVVMRPDGRADLTLELRAELRAGWIAPATAGLLTGGVLSVVLALLLLLWPMRPREVVFVVEPDQVPVLAGRLGVTSLSGLGAQPTREREPALGPRRELASVGASVGAVDRPRPAIGPVPTDQPAILADLVDAGAGSPNAALWDVGSPDAAPRDSGSPDVRPGAAEPRAAGVDGPSEARDPLPWPPTAPDATAGPVSTQSRVRPATPDGPASPL